MLSVIVSPILLFRRVQSANVSIVYKWTFEGKFTANMQVPANRMAFVALVSLDVLCFFSTSFWRRKAYNIFISAHIICFIVFLPMVSSTSLRKSPTLSVASWCTDRFMHMKRRH